VTGHVLPVHGDGEKERARYEPRFIDTPSRGAYHPGLGVVRITFRRPRSVGVGR
jgi:hypothetical protein